MGRAESSDDIWGTVGLKTLRLIFFYRSFKLMINCILNYITNQNSDSQDVLNPKHFGLPHVHIKLVDNNRRLLWLKLDQDCAL